MYGEATQLLGEVIERMERKEFLIYRRGLLFKEKGELSAFVGDMKKVMRLIQELPLHLQKQPSVQILAQNVLGQLESFENK